MGQLLEFIKRENSGDLITKWDNIGFIDKSKNRRNTALACEFAALYLLDNLEKYNGSIETLTHPIIVRIFRTIEKDLSVQSIFEKVIEIINDFSVKLNNKEKELGGPLSKGGYTAADAEAEFVSEYCDDFILTSNFN